MGTPHNVKVKSAQREQRELARLQKLWATGRATTQQIHLCMELERHARIRNRLKSSGLY
jgi:hypothetical protein